MRGFILKTLLFACVFIGCVEEYEEILTPEERAWLNKQDSLKFGAYIDYPPPAF